MSDPINPDHYQLPGAQPIDIAEYLTFNGGNAVKYVARSTRLDGNNKANPVEDLRKARWYIDRELDRLTTSQPKEPVTMNDNITADEARAVLTHGPAAIGANGKKRLAGTVISQADRIDDLETTLFRVEILVERAMRKDYSPDAYELAEILGLEEDE